MAATTRAVSKARMKLQDEWRSSGRGYGSESGRRIDASDIDPVTEARFWQFVGISFCPGACWNWLGSEKSAAGYARIKFGSTRVSVTRIAYALFNRVTPAGALICHKCDNPRCVRPDHLFVGTAAENMADKVKKKRHAHGEVTATAVLNSQQVMAIDKEINAGVPKRVLSRKYGVSRTQITRIQKRLSWAHLFEPLAPATYDGSHNMILPTI